MSAVAQGEGQFVIGKVVKWFLELKLIKAIFGSKGAK
jgi:hypothetical protein